MRKSILIGIAIALTAMVAVGCKSSPKETVYDVYVAGSEAHDPFWKTVLWVNGKSASAPSADGGLKAVFVSGNDVYVAGSEILEGGSSMSAALWKNGVAVPLTPSGRVSYAHSVFVSGSDVYVVGTAQQNDTGTWCATLWKMGSPRPYQTLRVVLILFLYRAKTSISRDMKKTRLQGTHMQLSGEMMKLSN